MPHPTIKVCTVDSTGVVQLTINDVPVGGDFDLYTDALEYAGHWCDNDLLVSLAESDGIVLGLQSDRVHVTCGPDNVFAVTWASYPLADVVKEGDLKFDPFGALMGAMFDTCDFVVFSRNDMFPEMEQAGYKPGFGCDISNDALRDALCEASDTQIRVLLTDLQYAIEMVKSHGGGY